MTGVIQRASPRLLAIISFSAVLSACTPAIVKEYELKQQAAERELPAFQQALEERDCFNVMFRFKSGLNFTAQDAATAMDCLDIQMNINQRKWIITGYIQHGELALKYGYDNYKAIFYHVTTGDLSLDKARDLYSYVEVKSENAASAEINQSNEFLARVEANRRQEIENRQSEEFLRLLRAQATQLARPKITNCSSGFAGSWSCTTQ